MEKEKGDSGNDFRIEDLYPHLSKNELQEAKENVERYVELVLRIFERISNDPAEYAKFQAELDKMKKQENQGKVA